MTLKIYNNTSDYQAQFAKNFNSGFNAAFTRGAAAGLTGDALATAALEGARLAVGQTPDGSGRLEGVAGQALPDLDGFLANINSGAFDSKRTSSSSSTTASSTTSTTSTASSTSEVDNIRAGKDPDTVAQERATSKGISLSEAKAELKAKYGDPKPPGSGALSITA